MVAIIIFPAEGVTTCPPPKLKLAFTLYVPVYLAVKVDPAPKPGTSTQSEEPELYEVSPVTVLRSNGDCSNRAESCLKY